MRCDLVAAQRIPGSNWENIWEMELGQRGET